MLRELVAADTALRRLEVERAAAFMPDPELDGQTTLQSQNAFRGAHVVQLLQQLWVASGRPSSSFSATGEGWAALGFQGLNPLTDLRGSGLLGLKQFAHFARACPQAFLDMLRYNEKELAAGGTAWYLPAVVSTQFTALLQLRDAYPLHRRHLEVIYDSVPAAPAAPAAATAVLTRCTPRRELLAAAGVGAEGGGKPPPDAAERLAAVWRDGAASDAEAGMYVLHHALLLHFKACWERDRPHVMEYNTYMEKTVYPTFFCEGWTMPEATQQMLAKKK
ncbi:hypothetical protein STCU_07057 [Strigomonas culicis]|uniref:ELMO domain-containing protein n=1 Tax=Strigomonas culicis TaxID=28005 RepID=S9U7B6_9TRYP|nr:hypothetical protein STCU_07057 [Strigomonas culicis]|eukprot:EPY24684.1 hypothetical protein STCU_07057 [Strigomonas culicis]